MVILRGRSVKSCMTRLTVVHWLMPDTLDEIRCVHIIDPKWVDTQLNICLMTIFASTCLFSPSMACDSRHPFSGSRCQLLLPDARVAKCGDSYHYMACLCGVVHLYIRFKSMW